MSRGNVLGFIESVGLASAIAAADAALKAANVELIGREITRGFGYVTIKIAGEVGAVQAAISAAKATSSKVARVWSTDVIPRPAKELGAALAWNEDTLGAAEWRASRGEDARLATSPGAEIVLVPAEEKPEPEPEPAIIAPEPEAEPEPEKTREAAPKAREKPASPKPARGRKKTK